jgi:hypothetical protein
LSAKRTHFFLTILLLKLYTAALYYRQSEKDS